METMLKYAAGIWFGALGGLAVAIFVTEMPMRNQCNELGEDYGVIAYNDVTLVCSDGKHKLTLDRQYEHEETN